MDDLYILSINDTALDDVKSFLGDHQHVLKLNEAKCSTINLENIRRDGFEMLGTVLGAKEGRERFINTKTDKLSAQLDHLHNLPHQQRPPAPPQVLSTGSSTPAAIPGH